MNKKHDPLFRWLFAKPQSTESQNFQFVPQVGGELVDESNCPQVVDDLSRQHGEKAQNGC